MEAQAYRARRLIKELCRIAHRCLAEFQRTTLGLPEGTTGVVMAIHTFGEYLDFHPHLHALVADGLFVDSGLFHVMPEASLAPLEELFRARERGWRGDLPRRIWSSEGRGIRARAGSGVRRWLRRRSFERAL